MGGEWKWPENTQRSSWVPANVAVLYMMLFLLPLVYSILGKACNIGCVVSVAIFVGCWRPGSPGMSE